MDSPGDATSRRRAAAKTIANRGVGVGVRRNAGGGGGMTAVWKEGWAWGTGEATRVWVWVCGVPHGSGGVGMAPSGDATSGRRTAAGNGCL